MQTVTRIASIYSLQLFTSPYLPQYLPSLAPSFEKSSYGIFGSSHLSSSCCLWGPRNAHLCPGHGASQSQRLMLRSLRVSGEMMGRRIYALMSDSPFFWYVLLSWCVLVLPQATGRSKQLAQFGMDNRQGSELNGSRSYMKTE